MDFELPVEHQLAYESAFNFARDEIRPHDAEIERTDDFPPWIWKRLAEQGYTGIAIPEEYGGCGGDCGTADPHAAGARSREAQQLRRRAEGLAGTNPWR